MLIGRPVTYFDGDGNAHAAQVTKDWGTSVNLAVFRETESSVDAPAGISVELKTSVQSYVNAKDVDGNPSGKNCYQEF